MPQETGQPAPPQLSDNELKTLAYFAIGVASEGSMAGKNLAYRLSFAGSINGITGSGSKVSPRFHAASVI